MLVQSMNCVIRCKLPNSGGLGLLLCEMAIIRALIVIRNTQTLSTLFGEEDGTYCACLQMVELDQEHITGRQKPARWKEALPTGLS